MQLVTILTGRKEMEVCTTLDVSHSMKLTSLLEVLTVVNIVPACHSNSSRLTACKEQIAGCNLSLIHLNCAMRK